MGREGVPVQCAAVRAGYGDYESLLDEPWLKSAVEESSLAKLRAKLDESYQVAVKDWSRTVVRQFSPMSFSFSAVGLDGKQVTNNTYAGKVLVMDLWATWCPPCRKGIPHYKRLHKEFGEQGVVVLGMSMDRPDDPAAATEAVIAAIWIFSCSPEQSKINSSGALMIIYSS